MENLWRKQPWVLTVAKAFDIIVGTSTNSGTARQMNAAVSRNTEVGIIWNLEENKL